MLTWPKGIGTKIHPQPSLYTEEERSSRVSTENMKPIKQYFNESLRSTQLSTFLAVLCYKSNHGCKMYHHVIVGMEKGGAFYLTTILLPHSLNKKLFIEISKWKETIILIGVQYRSWFPVLLTWAFICILIKCHATSFTEIFQILGFKLILDMTYWTLYICCS